MASTKRPKILLISTGIGQDGKKTNYRKVTTKLTAQKDKKIKIKKFDPYAYNSVTGKLGVHVIFEEGKIK